jgi:NAD(P)-dependent dehydrogenase (short-subunit alcohol dehydrogenase family)
MIKAARDKEPAMPEGEVIVVTGASAGVGRATVRAFARPGARIGLIARPSEGLEVACREVEAAGGEALAVAADVADHVQVETAASAVEERFGRIDIWINNAMTTIFAPVIDISPEEYKRATEVTYLGTVYGTMAALRSMMPRDRGCIVQVGSALAFRSIPLQAPYCGAKHGIVGFTESLRTELLHQRSRVHLTMVHLPGLNTPQFLWCKSRMPNQPQPVPPIYQPEVAARAIVWAAHHRRRELYVGAPTALSVWGNQFFPGLLDRYLARNGYQAQQTAEPVSRDRPNNLFAPLRGNFGAHGPFDRRAHRRSPQLWLTEHRRWVLGALMLGVGAMAGFAVSNGCLTGLKRTMRLRAPAG